jgi:hypothetical protein
VILDSEKGIAKFFSFSVHFKTLKKLTVKESLTSIIDVGDLSIITEI